MKQIRLLKTAMSLLAVLFLGMVVIARTTEVGRPFYLLQTTIGSIVGFLGILYWWKVQRRSLRFLISASLLLALFWVFAILDDQGMLRDYPQFVVVCLAVAAGLIGYLMVCRRVRPPR